MQNERNSGRKAGLVQRLVCRGQLSPRSEPAYAQDLKDSPLDAVKDVRKFTEELHSAVLLWAVLPAIEWQQGFLLLAIESRDTGPDDGPETESQAIMCHNMLPTNPVPR